MPSFPIQLLILSAFVLVVLPQGAYCFGAGSVPDTSSLYNHAFRHWDLENVIIGLAKFAAAGTAAFTADDVRRIYFGNWLRDYSQLMDITGLKIAQGSREAIMIVVQVLSFMTFGYATKEFMIDEEKLGVYLHVQHIDNPLGYGDGKDPKDTYDKFRPVVKSEELEIDPKTGMKNYIAREGQSYDTSAKYVRETMLKCIRKVREANGADNEHMHEAYRDLGSALHTLEDLLAHSNWCELALRKMGHSQVFCHVGDKASVVTPTGETVPPLVTGTFGAIDMIQSILGECQDHMASASISDFRKRSQDVQKRKYSLAASIFKLMNTSSNSKAGQAAAKADQMQQKAEELTKRTYDSPAANFKDTLGFIWEVLEWWEEAMKTFRDALKEIGLDAMIEKVENAVREVVWSLIASVVIPVFNELESELQSQSKELSHAAHNAKIYAEDSTNHDPTHTDLAKDHFDNVLNEPAGKVAQFVVRECVARIVAAWSTDNESEWNRIINEILETFHHPYFAISNSPIQIGMFNCMSVWVNELKEDERAKLLEMLTKESVKTGKNKREIPVGEETSNMADITRTALGGADEALGFFFETGADVVHTLEEAGKKVQEVAIDFSKDIEGDAQAVGKVAEDVVRSIGDGLDTAGTAITDVVQDIGQGVETVSHEVDNVLTMAGEGVSEFASDVAQGAEQTAKEIGSTVEEAVGSVSGWISSWW